MGCEVTFHDHVGRDQLVAAIEPMEIGRFKDLLESAIDETVTAALGRRECEVELTLCGDAEMERLNFDHMGDRSPTDVLAFPCTSGASTGGIPTWPMTTACRRRARRCSATWCSTWTRPCGRPAGDWSVRRRWSCWPSMARSTCSATTTPISTRSRRCGRWSTTCSPPSTGGTGGRLEAGSLFDRAGHAVTTGS